MLYKGGHNLKISPIIETDRLVLRNVTEIIKIAVNTKDGKTPLKNFL